MNSNKGIILSTYVYLLLIFFLLLLGTMLVVLNNTKILSNKMKENTKIENEVEEFNIVLLGDADIYIPKGGVYSEPGYTAQTIEKESLTADIYGTVNTDKIGEYVITYKVRYKGKTKQITRSVHIIDNIHIFVYVNDYQKWIVPYTGNYQIELWGASGNNAYNTYVAAHPSYGGYTTGVISLNKGEILYIYVGGQSQKFNCCSKQGNNAGSGGATDIRLINAEWNDGASLRSRIMVAGGAGGTYGDSTGNVGNSAGGLISQSHTGNFGMNASTQTAGGNAGTNGTAGGFGYAGVNTALHYNSGGGGYYGGGSGPSGGGGSSYISGHTGCVAIIDSETPTKRTGTGGVECTTGIDDNLCSIHYSGKTFSDTVMVDGNGFEWYRTKATVAGTRLMPNPAGGTYASGVGHSGNGYARITFMPEE